MRLRPRLAMFTLAVALPLLFGLVVVARYIHERTETDASVEFINLHMRSGERARCEATPETWNGGEQRPGFFDDRRADDGSRAPPADFPRFGGPLTRLFAYDTDFHSRNPHAPELAPELVRELRSGKNVARVAENSGWRRGEETLVRMAWSDGPCAFILARHREPPWFTAGTFWLGPFSIVAVVVIAMLIALGPIVRRIRSLAETVSQSLPGDETLGALAKGRDEVGDLARAFVHANQEIRSQIAQKEQRAEALSAFIENTTHDVMTPLSVLIGCVGEMQQRLAQSQAIDAALVNQIGGEAHYITSLVRNLGTAARLDAGEPTLQRSPVDMNQLVTRVVARHLPIARKFGIDVQVGVPESATMIDGDETLVEQALGNVVDNAVRYNQKGGHVAVVLECTHDEFSLSVVDDGSGIDQEEMSRLQERYYRGNQARTRTPGHGLGLHITAQVVRLHGWELTLSRSEYGGLKVALAGRCQPETRIKNEEMTKS